MALAWLLVTGDRSPASVLEDDTCNTGKLRTAPNWEQVCGEKVLEAAPWVPDSAHARLSPGEQLPQKQLGCCTAWSWWDHTLRFPLANDTIETFPLCQYLPSTGDKVATSHDCRHFNPLGLAVEGQPGSQAAPRGGASCQLSPRSPPCSSARRARIPPCWCEHLWSLGWILLPWALLPLPPCISTGPSPARSPTSAP